MRGQNDIWLVKKKDLLLTAKSRAWVLTGGSSGLLLPIVLGERVWDVYLGGAAYVAVRRGVFSRWSYELHSVVFFPCVMSDGWKVSRGDAVNGNDVRNDGRRDAIR